MPGERGAAHCSGDKRKWKMSCVTQQVCEERRRPTSRATFFPAPETEGDDKNLESLETRKAMCCPPSKCR